MRVKFMLISLITATFAFGIALDEIDTLTGKKLDIVIKELQNNTTSIDDKSKKIFEVFDELFDFEQMAKNCLGKAQWSMLNEKQQNEFIDKFVKHLRESYIDKLKLYTDQKIELAKSNKISASRVQLPMYLIDKEGKRYDIVYKFYDTKKAKGWLIYDVDILGVSITQTYRSQLDGVLKNGTFDALIKRIESISLDEQK